MKQTLFWIVEVVLEALLSVITFATLLFIHLSF